jgi:arylsulfatase A-like enzyme
MLIVPKPYWLWDYSMPGHPRGYATSHGTPYYYDQHVSLLFMGFGIRPGEYRGTVTPADIAPTFADLCGITLASRDGRVLGEALAKTSASRTSRKSADAGSAGTAKQ